MPPTSTIVIPARLASTRLSEKLLRRVGGKSVLQHTYDAASKSTIVPNGSIVVAVDDQRIADEVDSFGGKWVMTSPDCPSGTDRIAEVAQAMPEVDVFVNVQGDEPEIDPAAIDAVAQALIDCPSADMSTVGTPIRNESILQDPSNVKIVMAGDPKTGQGRAVYFSRSVVPHNRDGNTHDGIDPSIFSAEPPIYWHHLGLYAYRREFLEWFASQPPSLLETTERLEQLRAIESGKHIAVTQVDHAAPGIDTQADLDAFAQRVATR